MAGRGGGKKRVEMGEGMWERGGEEEKLKSAYGKNEFCDHIVFLQKPVFGEMWSFEFGKKMPKIKRIMPKTVFLLPKTPFVSPKIMFLADLRSFWRNFWRIIYGKDGWRMKKKSYRGTRYEKRNMSKCADDEHELRELLNGSMLMHDRHHTLVFSVWSERGFYVIILGEYKGESTFWTFCYSICLKGIIEMVKSQ